MYRYVARRLLLMVPMWFMVSLVVFVTMRILPGDVTTSVLGTGQNVDPEVVAELRSNLGLDRPLHFQYVSWLSGVVTGDLGDSLARPGVAVSSLIASRTLPTVNLAVLAIILGVLLAVPAGIIAALYRDSWWDYLIRGTALLWLAVPHFWTGIMVVITLLVLFQWSVPPGYSAPWEDPVANIQKMIWPGIIMGLFVAGPLARMTRSSMLEVATADYVRTARAKGLPERLVVWRHVLRNALMPVVTFAGLFLAVLLNGVAVLEVVFNIPGLGRLLVDSVTLRDYPVVQSGVLLAATAVMVVNLIVDIAYAWIDPRITYS